MFLKHVVTDWMNTKGGITMENRNYENVLEQLERAGLKVELHRSDDGDILARIANLSVIVSLEKHKNPPIPRGFKYVEGYWNHGFIIERETDGSQFVWVPVDSLPEDGTSDGVNFNDKFGRRTFGIGSLPDNQKLDSTLEEMVDKILQVESVTRYGGFYISRYNISRDDEGMPQSKAGFLPIVNITYNDAKKEASDMVKGVGVTSHLIYAEEYDSVLAWLISSKTKNILEISRDSTMWGNYQNMNKVPHGLAKTGSSENCCVNGIYGLAGNIREWTQESNKSEYRVSRGGCFNDAGYSSPVFKRHNDDPNRIYSEVGFRVALCIE